MQWFFYNVNKKALYGILIALIIPLGIFLFVNSLPKAVIPRPVFYDSVTTVVKNGKQTTDTLWHRIPDVSMINQFGKKVSLSDVSLSDSGRIMVVDFFFTHCPSICPGMTRTMKLLQNTVKKGVNVGDTTADYVQFISFSIDPEIDSFQELKKWADRFQIDPANWWLLTGDKQTIYDLSLKHMNLAVQDPKIDSSFPHTDIFVLIDKNGVIRTRRDKDGNPVMYHSLDTASMANLAEDIVLLSLEKDKKKKSFFGEQMPVILVSMIIALVAVVIFLVLFRRKKPASP